MKLFFREFGTSSQAFIIIHGLFGSSDLWIPFAKKLSKSFHVYCPDLRNHGRSAHSSEFSLNELSDDLIDFINDNNIENPIIMGHSLGGRIAMNFVLNYTGKIKKLIVLDISPKAYNINEKQNELINALSSINPSEFNSFKKLDEKLSENINNFMIRQLILKNIYKTKDKSFAWRSDIKNILNNLDKISKEIIPVVLGNKNTFSVETLFIKGGKSDYINDEDVLKIKTLFPKSKIKTIENASHWLHVDAAEELFSAVMNFVS